MSDVFAAFHENEKTEESEGVTFGELMESLNKKESENFTNEVENLSVKYINDLLDVCKGYRDVCPNDLILLLYEMRDLYAGGSIEEMVATWNRCSCLPVKMVMKE